MKRVILAVLLLCVIALAGCSPVTGDITDLMYPPKLTADQQAVKNALDHVLGKGNYSLKYPIKGDYRSAFILHNLDTDPEQEAVAFYCPNTDNAGTRVMVFKKSNGQWKVVDKISGKGCDVEEVDFGNFYGNGIDDIAIAWTQLTGTDLGLGVYSLDGKTYTYGGTFTDMKPVTLSGENKQDILLLKLDTSAHKAYASLIGYKDSRLEEISNTLTDDTVSGYAGIYNTKVDNKNAVLVDGYKGTSSMVTELLTFNNGQLQAPLLDKKDPKDPTTRDVAITCEDIDNDGIYEIPSPVTELPGYAGVTDVSKKLWLVSWSVISDGKLSDPKFSCVLNNNAGYYFIFPTKWDKNDVVTVDNALGDNYWSFRAWNGQKMGDTLFNLQVFTENDWKTIRESNSMENAHEITDNNGVVYVAQLFPKVAKDPQYLDFNTIRQNLRLMS